MVKPEQNAAGAQVELPEPDRVTVTVDPTRELVYRFLDPQTGDIVAQVPPEQLLEIARGIQDLLRAADRSSAGASIRNEIPMVNVRG